MNYNEYRKEIRQAHEVFEDMLNKAIEVFRCKMDKANEAFMGGFITSIHEPSEEKASRNRDYG